jgi:hypothetical protein
MPVKKVKDPLRSAAILKLSFQLAGNDKHPQFVAIYEGVLRDFSLDDADVDAYLAEHRPELEVAARGSMKGGSDGGE